MIPELSQDELRDSPFDPIRIAQVKEQAELLLSQAHTFIVVCVGGETGYTFAGCASPEAYQHLVLSLVTAMTSPNAFFQTLFRAAFVEMLALAGETLTARQQGATVIL